MPPGKKTSSFSSEALRPCAHGTDTAVRLFDWNESHDFSESQLPCLKNSSLGKFYVYFAIIKEKNKTGEESITIQVNAVLRLLPLVLKLSSDLKEGNSRNHE